MRRTVAPGAGSDATFVVFMEECWERHLRLARLLTGDQVQGEELLQDCLVKVYVRWRRVSSWGDPHAYLRRALVNGNVTWWRRRRREHLMETLPERPDRQGRQPDQAGHDDDLRSALRSLPSGQRAVVVLRHVEDLTEREVAQVLGCSIGTVKSQNARALGRLRQLLGKPEAQTLQGVRR